MFRKLLRGFQRDRSSFRGTTPNTEPIWCKEANKSVAEQRDPVRLILRQSEPLGFSRERVNKPRSAQ